MGSPSFRAPKTAARLELCHALWDLIWWIPRALWYAFVSHTGYERRIQEDLAAPSSPPETSPGELFWTDPPRLFLACAEVSGEVHGSNLARELRRLARDAGLSEPILTGLGGAELRAAGVETVGDPVGEATLHAGSIAKALPFYVDLIRRAACAFRGDRGQSPVDLFVPIDSPALHVPMARVARTYGVATWHFIAPQFWGWAPWRLGRYRKNVAHAFTILPFEPRWYRRNGVEVTHVGHPLLDALAHLPSPPDALDPCRTDWVLLPGSRRGEIEDNLHWMLQALEPLLQADPNLRVHIAQSRDDHRERIESILDAFPFHLQTHPNRPELSIGDLHGVLARCRGALAVSGTVLSDLLVHRIPSVVIYRDPGGWKGKVKDRLLTCGFFASTNLVAGRALLPEYCFGDEGPLHQVGQDLVRMHRDEVWRAELLAGLEDAYQRLGGPGACQRAAQAILLECTRRAREASSRGFPENSQIP